MSGSRVTLSAAVAVAGLVCVSSIGTGSAAADQSFPASAITRVTPDNWTVGASLHGYTIHQVPPLNQSPFQREAFVDLDANAIIGGNGQAPVDAGTLTFGVQLGCGVDVSNGINLGISLSPSVGVTIASSPGLTANLGVSPSVSAQIKPGVITPFVFGTKKLNNSQAGMQVTGVHITVSGCTSTIAIRPYATVAISTPSNDSTINNYGPPTTL